MKNALKAFQKAMDQILVNIKCANCFVDDIIISSKNRETHLQDLKLVFETLFEAGCKINFEKSEFGKSEISYLGFFVNSKGIKPDTMKVEFHKRNEKPRTFKQLRKFIGSSNYFEILFQIFLK